MVAFFLSMVLVVTVQKSFKQTLSKCWLKKLVSRNPLYNSGQCQPSLLNQKHNVRWFLLRRFVDLLRAWSLHIIKRNHPNKFLLISTILVINSCINLSNGLWEISLGNSLLLWPAQKKNEPEKIPFIATNIWMVLPVRWSFKYFFAPKSLISMKKSAEERKWQIQGFMLCKQTQQGVP